MDVDILEYEDQMLWHYIVTIIALIDSGHLKYVVPYGGIRHIQSFCGLCCNLFIVLHLQLSIWDIVYLFC